MESHEKVILASPTACSANGALVFALLGTNLVQCMPSVMHCAAPPQKKNPVTAVTGSFRSILSSQCLGVHHRTCFRKRITDPLSEYDGHGQQRHSEHKVCLRFGNG